MRRTARVLIRLLVVCLAGALIAAVEPVPVLAQEASDTTVEPTRRAPRRARAPRQRAPRQRRAQAAAPAAVPEPSAEAAVGTDSAVTLIVKLRPGNGSGDVAARAGGVVVDSVPALGIAVLQVPRADASTRLANVRADAAVERAELDQTRVAASVPSDPGYADQWALPKIAWDTAFGTVPTRGTATLAVLDTGVSAADPQLTGRLSAGYSTLGGDPTLDPNGHGTALAAVAAANTDDAAGIAGVAYAGVNVMPVQVLGADGTGQDSDVIAGLVWAADHGADVILMAFSNPTFSQSLQDAVDYAWSKGAVLVAATGNDGSSAVAYPAGDAKVVGVAATDQNDALWSGSNTGADVFIGAPGVDISTGSDSITGTSASAAIVAGSAALLRAADPAASNSTLVGRLARNADSVTGTGNGRVNLGRAVTDTGTDGVVPAGAAASGGPFVGPYVAAAAFDATLEAKCASTALTQCGTVADPWIAGNAKGWQELDLIPTRVLLENGPVTNQPITIQFDHTKTTGGNTFLGMENLLNFTPSANVTMTTPVLSAPVGQDAWSYTFNVTVSNSADGFVAFDTRLAAGAHFFTGSSLALGGSPSLGSLQISKPAAAPGVPDLKVTKSGPATAATGTTITYTLNYTNLSGDAATGVQLRDVVPPELSFVAGSCTPTCTIVGNTITWDLGTLPVGTSGSKSYQAVVTGANGTSFTNSVTLFGNQNDANLSDNSASVTTLISGNPSISGTVYNDSNGNGSFDTGEVGIPNVTVSRTGTSSGTATTDANGAYSFTNLTSGTYNVTYSVPLGFVNTGPASYTGITLATGQSATGKDFFASDSTGSIAGTVYNDVNGNGLFELGDTGLPGVAVTRTGGGTATTDANGVYSFTNLTAGTYSVDYTVPSGYANTGTKPLAVTLSPGQASTGNNFFARRQTTTTLTSSLNPSTFGDSVTFTATVTSAAGNPSSLGTVTFTDGANDLCVSVPLTGNTATCQTSTLAAGSHTITAIYFGSTSSPGFAGSTSDPFTQQVDLAPSTTTITCPTNATYDGNPHTPCTAVVTGAGGLNQSVPVSHTNNVDAGTATASANYAGDSNHAASSDTENFTIDPAPSTTTITCPTSVTYDGTAQAPCTAVVTGAGGLNQSVPVSHTNNVGAGTANASATYAGDANHTASGDTETFTIDPAPSTTTITCPTNVTYDGTARTPCTAVVTGAGGLNQSVPVTHTNNVGAGTATATASYAGDANHTASGDTETFTIDPAPSTPTITCPTNVTYDGTAQAPCTAVVTGAGGLNQPLTVTYLNNVDAGTATASASYPGDANHTGSSDTENFTIDPANSTVTITCPTNVTYDGTAQAPCTAVVTGAGGLNQPLTVTYLNNVDAGTATASASYAGDTSHTASSDTDTFTIDPAPSTTTITCPANVTYDGLPHTPCTAVVTGVGGLNQPVPVTHTNNVNAGTANASASYAGDANHTGSSDTETFVIDPAGSTTTITCPTSVTYTGAPLAPCTAVATGIGGLNQPVPVTHTDNVNAGTANASASYAGDANHTGSSDTETFTITPAPSVVTVTCPTNVTYDALPHTPCTAVVTGAGGLSQPVPVTHTNNVDAGTATATASYPGDANHSASGATKTFAIDRAPSTVSISCPTNVTYDGTPQTPCTAEVTGIGGLVQALTVTYTNNVNAGTATASAAYGGDPNHLPSSNIKNFTIDKAPSFINVFCPTSPVTFTGSPITPCSSTFSAVALPPSAPAITYTNNVNPGTATATVSYPGDANHLPSFATTTFVISGVDMGITKTCTPATVIPGDVVTCSLTVTAQAATTDVVVLDDLPTGLTFKAFGTVNGFTCVKQSSGAEVKCTRANIGTTPRVINYTVTVTPDADPGQTFTNLATVDAFGPDPNNGNDSASFTVAVVSCTIDKRNAPGPFGTEITATTGNDVICGSAFNDDIRGLAGNDIIFGGDGQDNITGDGGADRIFGGNGRDALDGREGGDRIFGNADDDDVEGGGGTDYANGGTGFDRCDGETRVECEAPLV